MEHVDGPFFYAGKGSQARLEYAAPFVLPRVKDSASRPLHIVADRTSGALLMVCPTSDAAEHAAAPELPAEEENQQDDEEEDDVVQKLPSQHETSRDAMDLDPPRPPVAPLARQSAALARQSAARPLARVSSRPLILVCCCFCLSDCSSILSKIT